MGFVNTDNMHLKILYYPLNSTVHIRALTRHQDEYAQEGPAEGDHPGRQQRRQDVAHEPVRQQTVLAPVQGDDWRRFSD